MNSAIVDPALQQHKLAIAQLLSQIKDFAQFIGNASLTKTIRNLQENINQPFLFVVIGEVKAGKSSFINALLGSGEICKTGADPCTNSVAKIVYADGEGYEREIKPGELRQIGRPVPILKQIAIVDTPGTNSPLQEHEDITKEFIPNSDLTVFVFFSKNPYTNTAWSLVDFAHRQWKKPVIFVLQQADLADSRELKASYQYIQEEATRRQIPTPKIFATSAKQAIENTSDGGFPKIQDFVRDTITGGKGYQLKLASNIGAVEQIMARLEGDITKVTEQLRSDDAIIVKMRQHVREGQLQLAQNVSLLSERLTTQYGHIIYRTKGEFREEMSVLMLAKRFFFSLLDANQSIEFWMIDLKDRAKAELEFTLNETSEAGAKQFLSIIQLLIDQLDMELNELKTNTLTDTEISSNVALPTVQDRYAAIESVQHTLSNLLSDPTVAKALAATVEGTEPKQANGNLASNDLLKVIEGVITAVPRGVFLTILDSIFVKVSALCAEGIMIVKRNSLIQVMNSELERNREKFQADISEELNAKFGVIYQEIDRSFADLNTYIEQERAGVAPVIKQFKQLQKSTQTLAKGIQQL